MRVKTSEKRQSTLVAIALAAYKPKPRFFSQQLQSLVDQTHQNWVCVITFDSSMREALKNPSIKKFQKDKRFVWRQNSHQLGVVRNFERAMALSLAYQPNAIAFCDQDDIWLPAKLQVSIDALNHKPPMSLVHCNAVVASSKKTYAFSNWDDFNPTPELSSVRHLLLYNTVSGASTLFDAKLARVAIRSPETKSIFHDRWVALAAALHGGVYPIQEKLYVYRQHTSNVFGSIRLRRVKEKAIDLKRVGIQRIDVQALREIRYGIDLLENRKMVASHFERKLSGGKRYSSGIYLALMFAWCAIEFMAKGERGRTSMKKSVRMFICSLLAPLRRSSIKKTFGVSRRRSAPRRRS